MEKFLPDFKHTVGEKDSTKCYLWSKTAIITPLPLPEIWVVLLHKEVLSSERLFRDSVAMHLISVTNDLSQKYFSLIELVIRF